MIDGYEARCNFCGGTGVSAEPVNPWSNGSENTCRVCGGSGLNFRPFQQIRLPDYQPFNKQREVCNE